MTVRNTPALETARDFLVGLSRPTKFLVVVTTDLLGIGACVVLACWLVQDNTAVWIGNPLVVPGIALASIIIAWRRGLYRAVVRYIGFDLIIAGAVTAALATLAGSLLMYLTDPVVPPVRWD